MDSSDIGESEFAKKRKFPWWIVNLLIGLNIPMGMFWLIPTFSISLVMIPVLLIANAVLVICYQRYIRIGQGKNLLYAMRAIIVILLAVMLVAPYVIINFDHQKSAYQWKKLAFTYGVGNKENCQQLLPDKMPDECENYLFITQGQAIAQDYRPSLYLAFHTDEATLREYEQKMKDNGAKQKNYSVSYDDYLAEWNLTEEDFKDEYTMYSVQVQYMKRKGFPQHAFDRLEPVHMTDFDNDTLVYYFEDYYYGCMIDYDSGLAFFWT